MPANMDAPVPSRARRAILVPSLLLLGAVSILLAFFSRPDADKALLYKGKPFEAWFYASKTNFFQQDTRAAAQEAHNALGTNAFPFLLGNLIQNRGSGVLYIKAYRSLPARVQSWLPFPILSDDIRSVTWRLIWNMPVLATEQADALTHCLPNLANPHLRMDGLLALHNNYRTEPSFASMCRNLLNDASPGIRLQAALFLTESATLSDPREPRLFPILIDGLENKGTRASNREVSSYGYQQLPPGGSRNLTLLASPSDPDQDEAFRKWILRSLQRLKPYLTQEQKNRLSKAISPQFEP